MFPLKKLLPEVQRCVWLIYDRLTIQELIKEWKKRIINVEQIEIELCKDSEFAVKIDYMWKGKYTTETQSHFYVKHKLVDVDMKLIQGVPKYWNIVRNPPMGTKYTFLKYL